MARHRIAPIALAFAFALASVAHAQSADQKKRAAQAFDAGVKYFQNAQ